jgi:putative thioredoxin
MEPERFSKDVDTADFPTAVLMRSRDIPVVVDFWAEWCGPCKVLGPLLEKAAEEFSGQFELAKIDIDQNPQLAAQFGIQGIPNVVAFRDGAPVNRFTGVIPEAALREWLLSVVPSEIDRTVDAARDAVLAGDTAAASRLFQEVLAEVPDHPDAGTGLAALLISGGATDEALAILGRLPPTADVERLKAAARLNAAQEIDVPALEARAVADPDNEEARLDLALALAAKGEFEPALDHLLKLVRTKGVYKDQARLAMLDVFEVLGEEHPLTGPYRRQLASALF